MKLHLENVCSFRKADFNFEPGKFYLVKGGNNSGKSAVLYSLIAVLLNSKDTKAYINNEALQSNSRAQLFYSISTDNGILEYNRGTNDARYTTKVNNKTETYRKLGRRNIFDINKDIVSDFLYDVTDERQIVNIQGEESGLFPFDRSGTEQFKLFEKIFNISSTSDVFRSINLDEDSTKSNLSELLISINDNRQRLTQIDDFLSTVNIENITDAYKIFKLNFEYLDSLQNDLTSVYSMSTYVNIVNSLDTSLTLIDIDFVSQMSRDLLSYKEMLHNNKIINSLSYMQLSDLTEIKELVSYYNLYIQMQKDVTELNLELSQITQKLENIKTILQKIDICPLCGQPIEGDTLCQN